MSNPSAVTGSSTIVKNPLLWSAAPSPLTPECRIDGESVGRMMVHHAELGVGGVFLGGTCGEGPWLRVADLEDLVRAAVEQNCGGLGLAVQITDNSALRMLDHVDRFARLGATHVVMAGAGFVIRPTPGRLLELYREVIQKSELPVVFYDRGKADRYLLPNESLRELYHEPRLVMIKDSSCDPERRQVALEARKANPDLKLLSGDEFSGSEYLRAGYDGLMLGGAVFQGRIAGEILAAAAAGNFTLADQLQNRMVTLMQRVYGGVTPVCWMAGLKYLLVRMGLFHSETSLLGYTLSEDCRAAIDEMISGPDLEGFRKDLWTSACRFSQ